MNWRLASRLSVLTLAILVVIITAILGSRTGGRSAIPNIITPTTSQTGLQGTDLGGTQAPNFQLTDQFGKTITLSQFKGKPIILTFLYTHCPDQCPLTAEKLHTVMLNLGSHAQNIAVLAVSTDPQRDTIAAAINFSQAHRMLNYWHYLIGTHAQLSPIWSSYSIYAAPTPTTTGGTISHTTAIFIIDKQGRERVYLGDDATSAQITADLQVLLKE
jgi:protein SCO1/2